MAIASRAALGAKRYDKQKPNWWTLENIDVDALDMSHPRRDVIGQNRKNEKGWDGSFDYRHLGLENIYQAWHEGFYHRVDEDGFSHSDWNTPEEYALLTEAWKAEINARRGEKK